MTERSESERAELVALADLIDNANGVEVCTFDPMRLEHKRTHLSGDDIARLGGGLAALRRLAAQDQKPPPAAGWNEAIEACTKVADTWRTSANPYRADTANAICQGIEALRHNAPPDSGATITVPFNPCLAKLREGEPFFVLLGRDKQAPNAVMTWANDREAAEGKSDWTEQARDVAHKMAKYSGLSALPDHGGADAEVREIISAVLFAKWSGEAKGWPEGEWSAPDWGAWRNRTELNPVGLSRTAFEEEADFLLKEVQSAALSKPAPVAANASAELQNDLAEMLRALGMSDAAQPKSPHEVFQSAIAEMKRQIANASAEARLREALIEARRWCDENLEPSRSSLLNKIAHVIDEALSTHPHASDCNKQGER